MKNNEIIIDLKKLLAEKDLAMKGTVCMYWRHAARLDGKIMFLIRQLEETSE